MRPFRTGQNIRDAYKKLTRLDLDPNDSEAERKLRNALEKDSQKDIARALRTQFNELIPAGATDAEVISAASRVTQTSGPVRDALRRALQAGADLGVVATIGQFDNIGLAFDWTMAHAEAAEWASRFASDLIPKIDAVTARRVNSAVSEWISNGEPLSKLRDELMNLPGAPFGAQRAERIAATETTRAFAEGSRVADKESGVVEIVEWLTQNDELVCPICGPMHGKRGTLEQGVVGPDYTGFPPAHVNCRCDYRAVVQTRTQRESGVTV